MCICSILLVICLAQLLLIAAFVIAALSAPILSSLISQANNE